MQGTIKTTSILRSENLACSDVLFTNTKAITNTDTNTNMCQTFVRGSLHFAKLKHAIGQTFGKGSLHEFAGSISLLEFLVALSVSLSW